MHTTQHPFDDVAVVAEKAARRLRVVTMIGSDLPALERATAHGALVLLDIQQGFERRSRDTSPSGSLCSEVGGPSNRVAFHHLAQLFGALLRFFCFRVLASLRSDVMFRVMKSAALLHLWTSVVLAKTLSLSIDVRKASQAAAFQVCGPLLRSGCGFGYSHARSLTLTSYA